MRLLGWGDLPLDDKAKKAIRENLALTAKAIYHYEMKSADSMINRYARFAH